MKLKALVGLFALSVAGGCASPTIDASDYSRACSVDVDCTLVFEGDVCLCDVERSAAAIALAARPAWSADFTELAAECGGPDASCPPSPVRNLACVMGTCTVAP